MSRLALTDEQREFGKAVAAALRQARTAAGMTVRDVSTATGQSIDTLRTLEAGRVASPGFALICAITSAVGADLTAFAAEVAELASTTDNSPGANKSTPKQPRPARKSTRRTSADAAKERSR